MKRVSLTILSCIFTLLVALSYGVYSDQSAEEAALASSQKWLSLVDKGKYAKSWDEAASLFRKAIPKEKWLESMSTFRQDLGKAISRKLKSKEYATTLPGAPDGEYVVIQYESSFENKKSAIELITPMLDKDGTWRVSGYYIR